MSSESTGGFARLGKGLVRRAWIVVAVALVGMVAAGAIGGDVAESLSSGGFEAPGAESTLAAEALDEQFESGAPNLVLLVAPAEPSSSVEAPAVAAAGLALTEELATEPGVADVVSYWSAGSPPPLRADDSSSALVLARIEGDENEVDERVAALAAAYGTADDGSDAGVLTVSVGGQAEAFREVGETIESDLKLAEMIAFPITLLLLVLVFRSLVSAVLPLAVGAFAILGTFLVLDVLAQITEVSIFSLNLTTAMGLGLAIDYALFVVSRYREERAGGLHTGDAVVRTVSTAGRAVLFSGLTVAASLAALLVFPLSFLRSFAYAGIPVVLLAVTGAVFVLPAVLALLGDRIDKGRIGRRAADGTPTDPTATFWARSARASMRHPVGAATAVIALLFLLGVPFLHVVLGTPDDRVLPESASAREVGDTLREDYSSQEAGALAVVVPGVGGNGESSDAESSIETAATDAAEIAAIDAYAAELSTLEGVARVDASTGIYLDGVKVLAEAPGGDRFVADEGQWLSVVPSIEPISEEGEQLVADVRAVDVPFDVLVGGSAPDLVDTNDALFSRLPLALAIIAGVIFVLLFLAFGSLLVPVKALVLNLLSLSATFGAMVWIFQDGNLSGVLDFTPTGMLDTTTPILMFCIAFGLSMDYEVFLLSRIKEEYLRTGDNDRSVEVGLGQTGRLITAAAALISVVFLAFATSSITFIKLFGLGLALAVIMDATLVRGVLVPAFMKLAGGANWWAPAWMQRLAARSGLGEVEVPATPVVATMPAGPLDLRTPVATRDDGADHDQDAGPDRVPVGTGGL